MHQQLYHFAFGEAAMMGENPVKSHPMYMRKKRWTIPLFFIL
jgi:hypothetical protein